MAVKQVINTYEHLKEGIKASLKRRGCEVQLDKISSEKVPPQRLKEELSGLSCWLKFDTIA
jgi:hypothetical protein